MWASGICVPPNTIDTKEYIHKYGPWYKEELGEAEAHTIRVRGKITFIYCYEKEKYYTEGDCTQVWLDTESVFYIAGDVTDEYKKGDYVVVTNTDDKVQPSLLEEDKVAWKIEHGYDNTWVAWLCGILGFVFVIFFLIITVSVHQMSPKEQGERWEKVRRMRELSEATSPIPRGLRPGCCIVGTAYYDPKSKELTILRKWRDDKLMKNKLGKTLVKMYYTLSPMLVMFIVKSEKLKVFTRMLVNPFVHFAGVST